MTNEQKNIDFFRPLSAHEVLGPIVGMVIEEVRTIFAPPKRFGDMTYSFTHRGSYKFGGNARLRLNLHYF